ncbi:hypothetical protein IFR05_016870 [Cadophora sp. M221]|nr:hypothetical protein IFR05_016870 [Cadophora sp. M221]
MGIQGYTAKVQNEPFLTLDIHQAMKPDDGLNIKHMIPKLGQMDLGRGLGQALWLSRAMSFLSD